MSPNTQPTTTSGHCDTREAIVDALIQMLATSGRKVRVYALALDTGLWSAPRLLDALRGFVTARAQREVQFLVHKSEDLPRDHGALIALAQRLPSLLLLREPDPEAAPPDRQSFVVNDTGALLLFDADQRLGAVFTAEKAGRARQLADSFAQAWDRARPLSELRALGL